MLLYLAQSDDTQRFLRCELCRKMEPEVTAQLNGWFSFQSMADPTHHLYACPECFHPDSQESYVLMGQKLIDAIPAPRPLTVEELDLL